MSQDVSVDQGGIPRTKLEAWLDASMPQTGYRFISHPALVEALEVRRSQNTQLTPVEISLLDKSRAVDFDMLAQLLVTNSKIVSAPRWQNFLEASKLAWPGNAVQAVEASKPVLYILRQAARLNIVDQLNIISDEIEKVIFGVDTASGDGSKDPGHDMRLLARAKETLPKAEVLQKWYKNHSFIPSIDALNGKKPQTLVDKLVFALSENPTPPRGSQRDRVVEIISGLPEKLAEQIYQTLTALSDESEVFDPLVRVAHELSVETSLNTDLFVGALKKITAATKNKTTASVLAGRDQSSLLEFSYLADLVQRPELHTEQIFAFFGSNRGSDIAVELERYDMLLRSKTQTEITFDVAAEKFQKKSREVREPIDAKLLDRACEICLEASVQNETLSQLTDEQFSDKVEKLSDALEEHRFDPVMNEDLVEFLAMAREGVRRTFGIYPHNTQSITITAILLAEDQNVHDAKNENIRGLYTQIGTGEGKSLILAVLNTFYALRGENTFISSSNQFLAQRDADKHKKYFALFGLDIDSYQHARDQYKESFAKILCGTIADISFSQLAAGLNGELPMGGRPMDRIFLDEGDSATLDEARDNCRISSSDFYPYRSELLKAMWKVALTGAGHQAIIDKTKETVLDKTLIPSEPELEMLATSAQSARNLKLNVNYTIQTLGDRAEIVIVDDKQTGRLKIGSHWGRGVDPFLSFKHPGTVYRRVKGVSAQQSNRTLIESFKRTMVCTGTAGSSIDRNELRTSYHLRGFDVPRHFPLVRVDHSARFFATDKEQLAYVEKLLEQRGPRACSVVRGTIRDALSLYQNLHQKFGASSVQVLTDSVNRLPGESAELTEQEEQRLRETKESSDDSEEHQSMQTRGVAKEMEIVRAAGRVETITVATRTMGRGQDIRPDPRVVKAGGYMVLALDLDSDVRSQQQVYGRAGRQGEPGDTYGIYSAESDAFLKTMPSLATWLLESCKGDSKVFVKFVNFWRDVVSLEGAVTRNTKIVQATVYEHLQSQYFTDLRRLRGNNPHSDDSAFPPKVLRVAWSRISHEIDVGLAGLESATKKDPEASGSILPPDKIQRLILDSYQNHLGDVDAPELQFTKRKFLNTAYENLQQVARIYQSFSKLAEPVNRDAFLKTFRDRLTAALIEVENKAQATSQRTVDEQPTHVRASLLKGKVRR